MVGVALCSPTNLNETGEVARELAHEQNPSKCLELSRELNQAITEEERENGGSWFTRDEFKDRKSV